MKKTSLVLIGLALMTTIVIAAVPQSNANKFWPQWRGPLGTGEALFGNPPLQWSETQNIRWKAPIPGSGHATPVIWDNQVFILTAVPSGKTATAEQIEAMKQSLPEWQRQSAKVPAEFMKFDIISLNRKDGTILWQKTLAEKLPHQGTHADGSWASASPVTDGVHVFAYFGSFGLYCLDMQGKLIWETDLGDLNIKMSFGEGSTPALYKDKLIVNWDHEGESFITVLNKNTGKQVWKKQRDEKTSWATPLVVELNGKPTVVVSATGHVYGYDLNNGEILWESTGMTGNVVPTPVYADGMVYVMSGFRSAALQAIKPGNAGDIVLWSYNKNTPYVPSPLLYKNNLYFFKENRAILTCLDALTGAPFYEAQRIDAMQGVYASPVAINDYIYLVSREGVTVVLRHGPALNIAATNKLDESFTASPVIVENELYLRGQKFLYCIAEK
ncbi:MAG TPA: PQQ-binding-like beta-propeller repeat protein [bacterium]|nr:PQQ-binding-like beta-propeller repeat protein [bacterium]HPN44266.1 PQQ-binding-like beta-propeller repeat protein [bacterium]